MSRPNTSPEHRKWAKIWFEYGCKAVVDMAHAYDLDDDDALAELADALSKHFRDSWSAFANREDEP